MVSTKTNPAVAMIGHASAAIGAVLLGGLLGLPPALAQDSGSVTVDVGQCVELESAAERRACFGAEVDAVLEAHGTTESDDASAVTQGAETDQGETANGERLARPESPAEDGIETRAVDASRESEEADHAYHGTITALRERLPYAYVITLDNGQVWRQVDPKKYPLRTGLEVRIYPSRWGESYRLSGEGTGSFILVRRVR
jgi:hypothetical protein